MWEKHRHHQTTLSMLACDAKMWMTLADKGRTLSVDHHRPNTLSGGKWWVIAIDKGLVQLLDR